MPARHALGRKGATPPPPASSPRVAPQPPAEGTQQALNRRATRDPAPPPPARRPADCRVPLHSGTASRPAQRRPAAGQGHAAGAQPTPPTGTHPACQAGMGPRNAVPRDTGELRRRSPPKPPASRGLHGAHPEPPEAPTAACQATVGPRKAFPRGTQQAAATAHLKALGLEGADRRLPGTAHKPRGGQDRLPADDDRRRVPPSSDLASSSALVLSPRPRKAARAQPDHPAVGAPPARRRRSEECHSTDHGQQPQAPHPAAGEGAAGAQPIHPRTHSAQLH